MIVRAGLVAAFVLTGVLTCGAWAAPTSKQRPAAPPLRQEPMTFYVVKGPPDSCGHGCDSWIEAEGKIELGTAARFKAFLGRLRDRNLPIYFASPGGILEQAIAMGNMLHARPSIARVGRTIVRECGFEAQDSDVCLKLKESGRELHGNLFTSGAICGSACPYVFAGAAVHELAPDAMLAIHSPKVILNFRGGQPDPSVVAEANQRGRERADRLAAAYLAKTGIDVGLLALTRTVKFEDIHVLTRDEVARFGLDRREIAETPWRFESNVFKTLHKVAAVREPGEASFRLLQWHIICFDANRFLLDFQRPLAASGTPAAVSITGSDAKPVNFVYPPLKSGGSEQWGLRMPLPALRSLLDRPEIEFTETSLAADGRRLPQSFKLTNDGWSVALEAFLSTCPAPKDPVPVQVSRSGEAASK
jgi:hypothetical protein